MKHLVLAKMILLIPILGLTNCGAAEDEKKTHYLEGCCNYVSSGICVNDYFFSKINREVIADFTLTSYYDLEGDLSFTVYEGNHPDLSKDIRDRLIDVPSENFKVSEFTESVDQFLIEFKDGNNPEFVHFINVSDDFLDKILPGDIRNGSVYFRTEPEYLQSPACSYDISKFPNP